VLAAMIPILAVAILATVWSAWFTADADDRVAGLAREAALGQVTTEALAGVTTEALALGALGALGPEPPEALRPYLRSRATGSPRVPAATLLRQGDRQAAEAFAAGRAAGLDVGSGGARALAPLGSAGTRAALAGTLPPGLTAQDYAAAVTELQAAFAVAPHRSRAAIDDLAAAGDATPVWRDPAFLAGLAAIWVLGLVTAWVVSWRILRSVRAAQGRAAVLARRNARLVSLVDAGRRVSRASDLAGVSEAIAVETRALLGARAAAVYLPDGDRLRPAGAAGEPAAQPVAHEEGVVGLAVEGGAPVRVAANADAAFPGIAPVAAIAAPLVAGRRVIGAVVAARDGDRMPDDDDELALRMIALAAGTAVEGARNFDSAAAMAHTDALTGLANRRRLDADLGRLARAGGPGGAPAVGVLMVDVDHFKTFNDRHGHPAGDALLRAIAAVIAAAVRQGDVVYRFGGEEFTVLLPGADREESAAVAERVRAAVAGGAFEGAETQPGGRVTVSVGAAAGPGDGVMELVGAADEALYEAKRAGRDVVVAG
jgi:diguanylate cyclase (GGDEF)-like protein